MGAQIDLLGENHRLALPLEECLGVQSAATPAAAFAVADGETWVVISLQNR